MSNPQEPDYPRVAAPDQPQMYAGGVIPYQDHPVQSVMATITAVDHLRRTRPWVRFMSILCFVGAGIMVLVGGFGLLAALFAAHFEPVQIVTFIIYLPMGLLYIIPGIYLHRYAGGITQVLTAHDPTSLENALDAQRAFWKFTGIMTIIVIALYILMIPVAVIMIAMSRARPGI